MFLLFVLTCLSKAIIQKGGMELSFDPKVGMYLFIYHKIWYVMYHFRSNIDFNRGSNDLNSSKSIDQNYRWKEHSILHRVYSLCFARIGSSKELENKMLKEPNFVQDLAKLGRRTEPKLKLLPEEG